jgi:uncharacterized protein with HEPN domain
VKNDRVYLAHIRDAIVRIESDTTDGRGAFLSNTLIQDAVIRNLEVIGEAVKGLSDELRVKNPEIPWKQIAGLRDVLIHQNALASNWKTFGKWSSTIYRSYATHWRRLSMIS